MKIPTMTASLMETKLPRAVTHSIQTAIMMAYSMVPTTSHSIQTNRGIPMVMDCLMTKKKNKEPTLKIQIPMVTELVMEMK